MKLSAITAILTVCLVTSCTPQISNKNIKDSSKMQNIQKEITMEQVRNRCRSMLHKVENRDDLIKQMYDTALTAFIRCTQVNYKRFGKYP